MELAAAFELRFVAESSFTNVTTRQDQVGHLIPSKSKGAGANCPVL